MKVKAQGLLNGGIYLQEKHGRDVLGAILRACSEPVRATYTSSVAIDWHPVEELCEFVRVAGRVLVVSPARIANELGIAGARANARGILLRLSRYVVSPEALMRHAAGMWRQFNDEGSMEVVHFDPRLLRIEVRELKAPDPLFCAIINGWCGETPRLLGATQTVSNHTACIARGDRACVFEVRGRHERG